MIVCIRIRPRRHGVPEPMNSIAHPHMQAVQGTCTPAHLSTCKQPWDGGLAREPCLHSSAYVVLRGNHWNRLPGDVHPAQLALGCNVWEMRQHLRREYMMMRVRLQQHRIRVRWHQLLTPSQQGIGAYITTGHKKPTVAACVRPDVDTYHHTALEQTQMRLLAMLGIMSHSTVQKQ